MKTPIVLSLLVPSLSFAADLDSTIGEPITLAPSALSRPSAGAARDVFTVAFVDANGDVRAARLAGDGALLGETVFGRGIAPVVATKGAETAVAWIADGAVQLARFDANGGVIDTRTVGPWIGREETLSLASNGDGWLLLRKANGEVIADRLAADGGTQSSATLAHFDNYENDPGAGSIATDGDEYLVVWHEVGEPRLARVTGADVEAIEAPLGFAARAAASDAGFRLAMMGRTGTPALVSHDLSAAQDVAVGADLAAPALAFDGALFVVGAEQRSKITGEPRLVGARLGANGEPIDDPSKSLFVLAEHGSSAPSIASREGASIVAYRFGDAIRARIVTRGDGVDDAADNCPLRGNADQADTDADGVGDACEDADADGVEDKVDLCPTITDAGNADTDADGIGDACDLETGSAPAEEPEDAVDAQSGNEPQGGCSIASAPSSGSLAWLALLAIPFVRRRVK